MAKKGLKHRPTEGITFIIAEANAAYQAYQQHNWAAVVSAVLGVIPALITFGVEVWRNSQQT